MATPLPDAVAKALEILRADDAIAGRKRDRMDETIQRVVAVFERVGAKWALVGGHAVGVLTQPRATEDFDFVVEEARLVDVLDALKREFGDIDIQDIGPAVRIRVPAIDLIRSNTHSLFRETLSDPQDWRGWKLPRPEHLLALKFMSAISPWRKRNDKMRDIQDFVQVYQSHQPRLDRQLMTRLAAQVYPGAEREFNDLLGKIDRGEPISL